MRRSMENSTNSAKVPNYARLCHRHSARRARGLASLAVRFLAPELDVHRLNLDAMVAGDGLK